MKLLEKDMEDLIIKNPQKYLNEPDLKLVSRQYSIGAYRFDLLFQDRLNSYGITFFEISESIFLEDPNLVDKKENQKQDNITHESESIGKNVIFNPVNINKDNLKIQEKIISIFAKQIDGEIKREEIINKVIEVYPGTNRTSVIPSDYCYNIINKLSSSFTIRLFESLGAGNYKCLGENYPYVGDIYWKDKKVGSWIKGKPVLTTDPRK